MMYVACGVTGHITHSELVTAADYKKWPKDLLRKVIKQMTISLRHSGLKPYKLLPPSRTDADNYIVVMLGK